MHKSILCRFVQPTDACMALIFTFGMRNTHKYFASCFQSALWHFCFKHCEMAGQRQNFQILLIFFFMLKCSRGQSAVLIPSCPAEKYSVCLAEDQTSDLFAMKLNGSDNLSEKQCNGSGLAHLFLAIALMPHVWKDVWRSAEMIVATCYIWDSLS